MTFGYPSAIMVVWKEGRLCLQRFHWRISDRSSNQPSSRWSPLPKSGVTPIIACRSRTHGCFAMQLFMARMPLVRQISWSFFASLRQRLKLVFPLGLCDFSVRIMQKMKKKTVRLKCNSLLMIPSMLMALVRFSRSAE